MTKDRQAILPNQNGFTLVEIMVTLAVIAIAAVLVSPAIMSMAPGMRLRTATNELHAGLMGAKSRAVKDNRNVVFTITTAVNCAADANGVDDDVAHPRPDIFETDGNGGAYRIFVDDGGGDRTLAGNNIWDAAHTDPGPPLINYPAEEILVDINDAPGSQRPDGRDDDLPENIAICAQTFPAPLPPATESGISVFTPTGLLQNAVSGSVTLETWDSSETQYQYQVSVSVAGSVKVDKL